MTAPHDPPAGSAATLETAQDPVSRGTETAARAVGPVELISLEFDAPAGRARHRS